MRVRHEVMVLWVLGVLLGAGCSVDLSDSANTDAEAEDAACPVGAEACACFANNTCNEGLECAVVSAQARCVRADVSEDVVEDTASEDADASTEDTETAQDTASAEDTETTSDTSQDADASAEDTETSGDTSQDADAEECAQTLCGEFCVNTDVSVEHCGGCDSPCATGEDFTSECVEGVCETTCQSGRFDCNAGLDDGCEATLHCDYLIERVSVSSAGVEGNRNSFTPSISADGRFVAFTSEADNLVEGDTNTARDVFVYDRQGDTIERVSVSSEGAQANGNSRSASISADGRFVAFHSPADNLVEGDTNAVDDVFVYDRQSGTTERVSISSDGTEGDLDASGGQLSADGRFVAFASYATNLVTDDTNQVVDVFVHDRQANTTERVSISNDGTQANGESATPTVSADGRFIVFSSEASNLIAGDTNAVRDVFVHDRQSDTTERISISSGGEQGNDTSWGHGSSVSSDGNLIAFYSLADNLVTGDANEAYDIFVRDRQNNTTERISGALDGADADSSVTRPTISADGRFVAFYTGATNLGEGDTNGQEDAFVHDRQTGATLRVSYTFDRQENNAQVRDASISADGRFVTFYAASANLVEGDANGVTDIFVVNTAAP